MDTSIDGGKIVGVAIIAHDGKVISLPKPNRHPPKGAIELHPKYSGDYTLPGDQS